MKNYKHETVMDLFAGAGGLGLGFKQAGFCVDTAIEIDEWACATLKRNNPSMTVIQRDIADISDSEINSLFSDRRPLGIIGGPPCQGFSHSNITKRDVHDPRNSLFVHFARFVRVLRPEFFVMENVPGLIETKSASGEPALEIILREFGQLGYTTSYDLLRAEQFGIPQIRQRLFIVGTLNMRLQQPFPIPTHRSTVSDTLPLFPPDGLFEPVKLWDAISDLPEFIAGQGEDPSSYPKPPRTQYQRDMRNGSTELWNHVAMRHSARVVDRFRQISAGESQSNVSEEHAPRVRSNGHLVSKKRYDQNNRRLHPDRPSHTIPASFYANFVHPFQHRNFTAREGARIQSFPDTYIFCGKPTVVSHKLLAREGRNEEKHLCQYNQVGNAVPPKLSRAIAQNIVDQL